MGNELLIFSQIILSDSNIQMTRSNQLIAIPENVKYPSKNAPEIICSSIDNRINFSFNVLSESIKENDTKVMSRQFKDALRNINLSIQTGE